MTLVAVALAASSGLARALNKWTGLTCGIITATLLFGRELAYQGGRASRERLRRFDMVVAGLVVLVVLVAAQRFFLLKS